MEDYDTLFRSKSQSPKNEPALADATRPESALPLLHKFQRNF